MLPLPKKPVLIHDVIASTTRVRQSAAKNIDGIHSVTTHLRVLALNALMEASRAGDQGRGFAVVAQEVKNISNEVETFAKALSKDLGGEITSLDELTRRMAAEANGRRMIDLALNAIELLDRNLYERTCDVRWWATDSAVVAALAERNEDTAKIASGRRYDLGSPVLSRRFRQDYASRSFLGAHLTRHLTC